jgi:hypothetical protein
MYWIVFQIQLDRYVLMPQSFRSSSYLPNGLPAGGRCNSGLSTTTTALRMSSFVCRTEQRRRSHESYTVAWISPLQVEQQAAFQMLDEEHERLPQPSSDHNVYKLGQIDGHNIVIAGQHRTGNSTTATVVAQIRMTFRNLKYGLLVGIGGGVPRMTSSGWVRLGHVVVGTPNGRHSGVVQYDYGKALSHGKFDRTGALAPPPVELLNAAQALAVHRDRASVDPVWQDTQRVPVTPRLHRFAYPGAGNDRLYQPDYIHSQPRRTCAESGCDEDQRVRRPYEDGRTTLRTRILSLLCIEVQ